MRTLLAAAAATLMLAGCGSSNHSTASTTPAPAASPTYDGSTIDACKEADQAANGSDEDFKHAQAARGFAELSDVPALREVAKKFTDDTDLDKARDDARAVAAAITISTWCLQHHVKP